MGNEIALPAGFGPPPAVFANSVAANDELSSGIVLGFPVLGYRGKVWRVKHRGEETDLLNDDGDARASVEVVIIKASDHLSKLFYEGGYQEGQSQRPDCWSNNGVTPDASVETPQCRSCAICPKNQFGSRITESGKRGKACSDHKRLAVVPLLDPENEEGGGPMLLRVPADSLKELSAYAQMLKGANYGYFAVGTRIGFDREVAHPKLVMKPIRPLTDEEATIIVALRGDPRVARVLSEEPDMGEAAGEQTTNVVPFEQPAAQTKPPAPRPTPAPQKPVQAAPVAQAPKPVVVAKPAPAVAPVAAKPQSPISAAMANPAPVKRAAPPVAVKPTPAPVAVAAEPEQGDMEAEAQGGSSLDDELDALLAE